MFFAAHTWEKWAVLLLMSKDRERERENCNILVLKSLAEYLIRCRNHRRGLFVHTHMRNLIIVEIR